MEALFAGGRRGGTGPLRFVFVTSVATATADLATRNGSDPEAGVSVLFSVPKKVFKRAWKRNLIKRRMRESYRVRKHDLVAAAVAAGTHIDIALICSPPREKGVAQGKTKGSGAGAGAGAAAIPDFKTLDNAIEKILSKILERC